MWREKGGMEEGREREDYNMKWGERTEGKCVKAKGEREE